MEQIKIEEIANELGIKSRELISCIGQLSEGALFSLNMKSGRSKVNVKIVGKVLTPSLYLYHRVTI